MVNGEGHIDLPDLGELSATEALAVVAGEMRREMSKLCAVVGQQSSTITQLAREVDRLRLRVRQPHLEELNKRQAAEALGVSTKSIEVYARRYREGVRPGLEHFYRPWSGGRRLYTTREAVEAFKRQNKILD